MLETPGSTRSRDIGKGVYRTRRETRDKNPRVESMGSEGSDGRVGGWAG